MILEHGVEQVALHHRQRLPHGVNRLWPAVAVKAKSFVGSTNCREEREVLRFRLLSRAVK